MCKVIRYPMNVGNVPLKQSPNLCYFLKINFTLRLSWLACFSLKSYCLSKWNLGSMKHLNPSLPLSWICASDKLLPHFEAGNSMKDKQQGVQNEFSFPTEKEAYSSLEYLWAGETTTYFSGDWTINGIGTFLLCPVYFARLGLVFKSFYLNKLGFS